MLADVLRILTDVDAAVSVTVAAVPPTVPFVLVVFAKVVPVGCVGLNVPAEPLTILTGSPALGVTGAKFAALELSVLNLTKL